MGLPIGVNGAPAGDLDPLGIGGFGLRIRMAGAAHVSTERRSNKPDCTDAAVNTRGRAKSIPCITHCRLSNLGRTIMEQLLSHKDENAAKRLPPRVARSLKILSTVFHADFWYSRYGNEEQCFGKAQ
jgi:hypothetical protein